MNPDFEKHWRIGGAVILGALVVAALWVSTRTYFGQSLPLHTRLGSVAGLRVGTDVLISGYSAGHVLSIRPLDRTLRGFEVQFQFDQNYQVPDDSTIALYQGNPLDVVRLSITSGKSAAMFKAGDLVPTAPDQPGLLDSVATLGPKAEKLLDHMDALIGKSDELVTAFKTLVGDPAHPADGTVSAVLANADGALKAATNLEAEMAKAKVIPALGQATQEITNTLKAAQTGLTQLQSTEKHADVLLDQFTALTRDNAQDLRHMAHDGEFVMRSLANDVTTLLSNLGQLAASLNDLAQEMQDNPNEVIFGRRPHEEPGKKK